MRNVNPPAFFLLICLVFVLNHGQQGIVLAIKEDVNTNLYIVYLGEKQHDDPKHTEDSHHEMLAGVVGSKELASELMVYNYKHGFSGFAAKLTESQAKKIAELPSVIRVIPNRQHKLHTTRSYDYMGLSLGSNKPSNLLKKVNGGDGIIIGVIDSGINPESRSFHDEGLGPIPAKWKGSCESGPGFDGRQHCNKKLIGARSFVEGAIESMKRLNDGRFNMTSFETFNTRSPTDTDGHGTHVSGIAAGSYVGGASYNGNGIAAGTLRGGAPKARVAMYKVCWNDDKVVSCGDADMLRACDQAIYDGVDVLQISIGKELPNESEVIESTYGVSIGTYHAVAHGIPAVLSGGNDGPKAQSVTNVSPWMITVGASTMDRDFRVTITLGNNLTLPGSSLYLGNLTGEFIGLVYANVACQDMVANSSTSEGYGGNVVLCFSRAIMDVDLSHVFSVVEDTNAAGVIVAEMPNDYDLDAYEIPCAFVDYEVGSKLLFYIQSNGSPMVKLGHIETIVGESVLTRVAHFSSRGPNSFAPSILKPDITAPGVKILAALVKPGASDPNYFGFLSGTSMAAPHVSGIVALLRASHPRWSPAAIKSALMTTAWNNDQFGYPIFAMGSSLKPADPFDMGAGLVNPNGADDPGLVYDMVQADYIHYLCGIGYTLSDISRLAQKTITCPKHKPSLLNLNLPSITIPSLPLPNSTLTIKRTVTNVGPVNSAYKALITAPIGTTVSVTPNQLLFNSKTSIISFKLTVSAVKKVSRGYNFGTLTWTDGVHAVRSPISVRI